MLKVHLVALLLRSERSGAEKAPSNLFLPDAVSRVKTSGCARLQDVVGFDAPAIEGGASSSCVMLCLLPASVNSRLAKAVFIIHVRAAGSCQTASLEVDSDGSSVRSMCQ